MKLFDLFRKNGASKKQTEKELKKLRSNTFIVLEAFTTAYTQRFKKLGRNADSIMTDESLADVTANDIITTSHMLMDIHEVLNIKLDYIPGDEYTLFPTVGDAISYLVSRFDYNINVLNPHLLED